MTDTYELLKNSIITKYGPRMAASIRQFERQPESAENQAFLTGELRAAGVDRDPEIMSLATRLSHVGSPVGGDSSVGRVWKRRVGCGWLPPVRAVARLRRRGPGRRCVYWRRVVW